jgi:hypothetical protein
MQELNPLTMQCTYSTPCGWCTKWDKRCDKRIGCGDDKPKRGLRAKTNIVDDACELPSFTCSLCGKTILAELVVHKDGTTAIKQESTQIRGGLGNQVLYDNLCSQCAKKMSCFDSDKFLTIIDKRKNNTQSIISQNNTEEELK